ncbi:MAG: formate dehydrogenase subunit gamma [Betaproteobacteria bacterium]|nr:formate dehydrogenase subunit gamma [Betaproteobacteria bacterium]
MHGSPAWGCAARCVIALLLALMPQAFATAQQQTPTQQEAARQQQTGQPAEAQREITQPLNNAPFWRDVRAGDKNAYQTTQVRGVETNVLIQNEGEMWRRIRNGPITVFGGWLVVVAFLAIGLFYWWRGEIMLHEPRTGRVIVRFTSWERILHWTTAIAFVTLAVSGIFMLFGRYVILPLFGYTVFSTLTIIGKNLHNFIGPLFVVCTLLMILTFIRDNFIRRYDWTWMRRIGDFLKGRHVPAGKYNAGEKVWFWLGVTLLGIIVSATGLVLDFPNFGQGREAMQIANVIHAVAAVGFMALSLGHIYLGTIGLEGSYDAMRHGTVDETWAKEHHDYRYQDVMARHGRKAPGMPPKTAPASSMQEGWKL